MNYTFLCFYTIITGTEIYAEISRNTLLVYATKPLLVISLIIYFLCKTNQKTPNRLLFLAALFFALFGDIFLMIRNVDLFIPGLATFLLMQICYIFLFNRQIAQTLSTPLSLITFIPFIAFAVLLLFILAPGLPNTALLLAVAIYAITISFMSWLALKRRHNVSPLSFNLVFGGALLFMISDSLIAIDKFVTYIPNHSLWVMSTYAIAQLLITIGITKTNQAD